MILLVQKNELLTISFRNLDTKKNYIFHICCPNTCRLWACYFVKQRIAIDFKANPTSHLVVVIRFFPTNKLIMIQTGKVKKVSLKKFFSPNCICLPKILIFFFNRIWENFVLGSEKFNKKSSLFHYTKAFRYLFILFRTVPVLTIPELVPLLGNDEIVDSWSPPL